MSFESKPPTLNIFESKVIRSEPKRNDKKAIIWNYFIPSDKSVEKIILSDLTRQTHKPLRI